MPENKVKRQSTKVLSRSDLGVLDVVDFQSLKMGKGHDCWYNNSWVSTDLLILRTFNASPEESGLVEYSTEAGVPLYHFPEKRVDTLPRLLKKQKERVAEVARLGKEGQQ